MLTGIAKEHLRSILECSSAKDLEIIGLKIIPGTSESYSKQERIEAILSNALQPSEVLRQQRLTKPILRRYLWRCQMPVTLEQSKSYYIKILLDMWQVKDDDYLLRFLTADEIEFEIKRFEEKMKESLQELKLRIRAKPLSYQELLHMKKSMERFLRTIDSIGNMESSRLLSSQEATPPLPLSDVESDTSSESSIEIVEDSPGNETTSSQTPPQEQTREPSLPKNNLVEVLSSSSSSSEEEEESSMDIFENSVPQQPSSRDIFNTSPSQRSSSVNIARSSAPTSSEVPFSAEPVEKRPSSSQELSTGNSDSVSSESPNSRHDSQRTSPSKRITTNPASESLPPKRVATASSQKHFLTKLSKNNTSPTEFLGGKRYVQTDISHFFAQDLTSIQKHSKN